MPSSRLPFIPNHGRHGRRLSVLAGPAGVANADFVWDDSLLDAWLTNLQAMIPDAFMAYRRSKPEARAAIIAYLKELT
jgi:cytochrome c